MASLPVVSLRPTFSTEANNHATSSDSTLASHHRYIYFHHPGYERPVAMFRLPAYDLPIRNESVNPTVQPITLRGIHHRTALDACTIVACNVTGFLSPAKIDRDDFTPPVTPVEAVLTDDDYWYYPSGWDRRGSPYPVVPNFENWCYPSAPPPHWIQMIVTLTPPKLPDLEQH